MDVIFTDLNRKPETQPTGKVTHVRVLQRQRYDCGGHDCFGKKTTLDGKNGLDLERVAGTELWNSII